MNRKRAKLCCALGWAGASFTLGMACASELPTEDPGQRNRALEVHSGFTLAPPEGGEPAKGLLLFESGPAGSVTRLLLALPEERSRLVITYESNARTGRKSDRLLDDTTGAWLQVEWGTGQPSRDNAEAYRKWLRELQKGRGDRRTAGWIALRTSSGRSWQHAGGVTTIGADFADFGNWLSGREYARELVGSVPASLLSALAWLNQLAVPVGDGRVEPELGWIFQPLTSSLGQVLSTRAGVVNPAKGSRPWRQEKAALTPGLTLTEPELLELTSRFRSLSNTEPLADARLAGFADRLEE